MSSRKSARNRRPPARLDSGGDETAVQQALRISVQQQRRVVRPVPFAPEFHPTEEEFQDPLAYIQSIAAQGFRTGIVKIVPPRRWRPEFGINVEKKFETYRQALHHLQEGESFDTGDVYNQRDFQLYADSFQETWLQEHPDVAQELHEAYTHGNTQRASEILEREYWSIVERASEEEVFVDYANNMDTKQYGTPFQTSPKKRAFDWDLTNLVHAKSSLLKKLNGRIAGVTSPWLYFGCMFATFCWHIEDHSLYSLNYMHHGANKVWYGIPEAFAARFEHVLRRTFPERFRRDPDLLHQLVTMISPSYLMDQGVAVCKTIQAPGDLIVTFPRGYHGGFSHGWNCAEAVNFALMDWMPVGRQAVESYRHATMGRSPTFSHDRLLWDICQDVIFAKDSSKSKPSSNEPGGRVEVRTEDLPLLADEFQRAVDLEMHHRRNLQKAGMNVVSVPTPWDGDPFQCLVCKAMHFFSFCICRCRTNTKGTTCLEHALESGCSCGHDNKILCIQVSDSDLQAALSKLKTLSGRRSSVIPMIAVPFPHKKGTKSKDDVTGTPVKTEPCSPSKDDVKVGSGVTECKSENDFHDTGKLGGSGCGKRLTCGTEDSSAKRQKHVTV